MSHEYGKSQEDKMFLSKMNDGIKRVEGHYEILLPFRESDIILPNNRIQAEQSAIWMKKKFFKNKHLYRHYTDFTNNLITKKYARRFLKIPRRLRKERFRIYRIMLYIIRKSRIKCEWFMIAVHGSKEYL